MNKEEEFNITTKFNIDSKPLIIDGERYYSEAVLKLYAKGFLKSRVKAISDEFKKILEVESDCKGIYLTKGTIRGSEALDAFEIWITKLLK